MNRFKTLVVTLISLLIAYDAMAVGTQYYQAKMVQSRWQFEGSPIRCVLKHEIPRYGEARFVHLSGGELGFFMSVKQPPVRNGVAIMLSAPAMWKPGEEEQPLGQLALSRGDTPFYSSRDMALRLMYELEAGRFPTVHYRDWADNRNDVYVRLSAVRYREATLDFETCIAQLLPYGFDDLHGMNILFDTDSHQLTENARAQLEKLLDYLPHDKEIKRITISGHADSRASHSHNDVLSMNRAYSIGDYLVASGLLPEQIKIDYFGKRRPIKDNRTPSGLQANRRVEIRLIK